MSTINFERRTLKNGLCVIHHLDHSTPFVVVNMLYKVGARDESPDKTGFAHLFEHLMFEGTKAVPYFDGPLQEAGGENNAFTNNDYTNYYDIVPAVNAEIAFWIEADRMRNLNINTKSLSLQKKVVIEEFKENYINQPYGDAYHLIREMVYTRHPYQWPTIGKDTRHIEQALLADVRAFYNSFYQPNNAVMVVSGNISAEKAYEFAEKWFGELAEHTSPPRVNITEPEQTARREKKVYAPVPQDCIYLAFQMPGRTETGYYEADVITDILSTGSSSRLHHRLIKDKRLFSEIDAYISGSNDTGMLVIEGKTNQGVSAEIACQSIWEELHQLKTTPVSEEELEKVKNKMLTYMNFSDVSLLNRTISLAYYEMLGDASMINREESNYEAVTAQGILQFANQHLTLEKSNTLYYLSNTEN